MKDGSTKGEKKILLQFVRFTETDLFAQEVKRIRKAVGLPKNGIKSTSDDIKNLHNIARVPDKFPKEKKGEDYRYPFEILDSESRKLVDRLPINNIYLSSLVKYKIIFDRFFYEELENFKNYFHEANVCEISDAESELTEYAPDPVFTGEEYRDHPQTDILAGKLLRYPIAIRIHPDASQRDVTDFIKKHWNKIKSYQDQYIDKNRVASFRNSKTKINQRNKERNNFIYENKDLPKKEIMHLLAKKYGWDNALDYAYIGTIISLEDKRRKKV